METTKTVRDSNIELLRILTMLGVIVLHYNNPAIGGGLLYAAEGSANFYLLYFLESICMFAVNIFIIISGFYLSGSDERKTIKPLELLVQVIVLSVAVFTLKIVLGREAFSATGLLMAMVPNNWFVILYIALFLISPFLNAIFHVASGKTLKTMLVVLLVVLSIYPTLVDVFSEISGNKLVGLSTIGAYGSQWGYTLTNFVLLYLIGAYLRKTDLRIRSGKLLLFLALCIILLIGWARVNDFIGFTGERSAWVYSNPIVILGAAAVFLLFRNLKLKPSRAINALAKGAFTVYLLHAVFVVQLNIPQYAQGNVFALAGHILISAVVIYGICWAVYWVYDLCTAPLFRLIAAKGKLPVIKLELLTNASSGDTKSTRDMQ